MAHLVLDDCLARLFSRVVSYRTSIVAADGGEEDRNANWTNARRLWRVNSQGRIADDLIEQLEMHFHMTRGAWNTFLFKDRGDFNHWQVSTSPGAIPLGAGGQLVKYYGSGANQRIRTITNPISGTVKIDGVLQTTEVDYETGIVSGGGSTAEFEFYTRVRFAGDDLDEAALGPRRKYLTSQFDLIEVRR